MTRRSEETLPQFHTRMVRNAEAGAERFEARAAATPSAASRDRFSAKASVERRNADHHRALLAALGDRRTGA